MRPSGPQLLTPALIRRTLTYRWVRLGLLFASGLLAFFTRLAPAVAIPDLSEAFVLNAAELGLLTSLYLWPFALMQPVAGVLTDRFGSRRTVTGFLIVAGIGQVLFASAPTYPVALIGRALTGLGASILYVGAARIMAQWFRSREFGTLTGAWTSVANLGGLTAAAPLMALITLAGWRLSLGGVGLVMLATALLVWVLVRDSPSELGLPSLAEIDHLPPPTEARPAMPLGEGVLVVLRAPNTWLLGSYAFLLFGTMTMMQGLWAVPYLMDAYGQTQQQAANALTLWAMGLIIGCTLWGYVADRIVRSRKRVVLAGAVVYALLWALLAVRPVGLPVGVLWVAMFWGGFFASTWIPAYAQLKDSVPPQVVATAMGILNLFFWLGGAVYQQVSGLILAEFSKLDGHTPVAAYQAVFWVCLASVGISIALVALSREARP
ncbi:MAG TPA: MFS transporter, partial [Gemmatimonadales bacterium]|nr:MFS transporter [Gemmatimonadales bacterium]